MATEYLPTGRKVKVKSPPALVVVCQPAPVDSLVTDISAPATEPPVDLERLNDFAGGSPSALQELVDLWVNQTTEQMDQIEAACKEGNAALVARVAHSCAGASSTCGITAVVPALRRLEAIGNAGDLSAVPQHLAAIRREFDRAKCFLESRSVAIPQVK